MPKTTDSQLEHLYTREIPSQGGKESSNQLFFGGRRGIFGLVQETRAGQN